MSRKSGDPFSDKDMRQSMLCVENIDVFYGDAQALDGVSLEVEEGAIVAIVGANGAGKTSLICTIAGMLRPARGAIRYRGGDIAGWPSYRVCDLGIGQVAEGRQVFPTLTVSENLDMGAMLPRARAMRDANRERRSEEHTSELQSPMYLVCRLLLEKKKKKKKKQYKKYRKNKYSYVRLYR